MIEYKGYIGVFEFNPDINLYHGTVINTHDMITFCGASTAELREERQKSIEVYLEVCEEEGKAPDKPFSGTFEVQTSPALHCRLAWHAQRHHLDLNTYVQEVLEKAVLAG